MAKKTETEKKSTAKKTKTEKTKTEKTKTEKAKTEKAKTKKTKVEKTKTEKKTPVKKAKTKDSPVKKASTKKAVSKTATAKTKGSNVQKNLYKQTAAEKKLAKELTSLAAQLDAEGLVFLIEQARIHLYNMEVVRLQEQMDDLNRKKNETIKAVKNPNENKFRIEGSPDGSVYHIILNGKWKLINSDELLRILKIINAPVEEDEARLNLLHWFFKERSDFVGDFGLRDTHDERWLELIKMFKTNFKLKK